tara:strand:- start:2384 stop:2563 length:180 start_codon:yes stop_codon:yes gene_type:complete
MKKIDILVFRLFDESLSEKDKQILLKRLCDSPEARKRYRELVVLESLLCNPGNCEGVIQ